MKNILYYIRIMIPIIAAAYFYLSSPATSLTDPISLAKSNEKKTDTLDPIETVQKFILWYKDNKKYVYSFRLVHQVPDEDYRVNLDQCKSFLRFLQSSGYISAIYTSLWWDYFQSRDIQFKEFPQNEGPPEGFDVDLVWLNQEPELIYSGSGDATWEVVYFDSLHAKVNMYLIWPYEIELSRVHGHWQIDYISINDEP
jgi:hypothetical protein